MTQRHISSRTRTPLATILQHTLSNGLVIQEYDPIPMTKTPGSRMSYVWACIPKQIPLLHFRQDHRRRTSVENLFTGHHYRFQVPSRHGYDESSTRLAAQWI